MGAWGAGLYSDDFAADLKTTVATLCRLPRSGDELVEMLTEMEPAATTPDDTDHTTFWLVVADQLHRRGIASAATDRALAILDDGSNLDAMRSLGMSDAAVRTRASKLEQLRARLAQPPPDTPRRTLKRPQALLAERGDVFAFPVDDRGRPYNPYFTRPERAGFSPAGWGSCVVVASGHAFDYLAWYQAAPSQRAWRDRPSLERAAADPALDRVGVGTLNRAHVRRMGFELLGTTDPPSVDPPTRRRIASVVASDIGLVNVLSRGASSTFG
jgi:hypothetical protein